jgi:hypothetical protein
LLCLSKWTMKKLVKCRSPTSLEKVITLAEFLEPGRTKTHTATIYQSDGPIIINQIWDWSWLILFKVQNRSGKLFR